MQGSMSDRAFGCAKEKNLLPQLELLTEAQFHSLETFQKSKTPDHRGRWLHYSGPAKLQVLRLEAPCFPGWKHVGSLKALQSLNGMLMILLKHRQDRSLRIAPRRFHSHVEASMYSYSNWESCLYDGDGKSPYM